MEKKARELVRAGRAKVEVAKKWLQVMKHALAAKDPQIALNTSGFREFIGIVDPHIKIISKYEDVERGQLVFQTPGIYYDDTVCVFAHETSGRFRFVMFKTSIVITERDQRLTVGWNLSTELQNGVIMRVTRGKNEVALKSRNFFHSHATYAYNIDGVSGTVEICKRCHAVN